MTRGASGHRPHNHARLASDGAAVAVVDHDGAGAEAVASEIGGVAYTLDVHDGDAVPRRSPRPSATWVGSRCS